MGKEEKTNVPLIPQENNSSFFFLVKPKHQGALSRKLAFQKHHSLGSKEHRQLKWHFLCTLHSLPVNSNTCSAVSNPGSIPTFVHESMALSGFMKRPVWSSGLCFLLKHQF